MNSYDGEFTASDIGLNIKLGRVAFNFPWLEFAKNWHSDEEFQELLDKYSNLNDNYEKEVIRSSKIESQIIGLKSQLQQQALPVVPECVAELFNEYRFENIQRLFEFGIDDIKSSKTIKALMWRNEHPDTFSLAFITGKYEVEKPQLFRLKLKNATISNYYLWLNQATGKVFVDKKFLDWTNHDNVKNIFTEQEIPKISDGAFVNNEAFELVPVEDGE
ncbi:DUF1642 domain-containing protein [Lactococcus sp. EKM203L]|nr:DUF1642 domain-containing protein [Lactococcus sp. EKM201L]KAF6614112.1 DUF1642 domain-containing protein [Lactococcus sp. EKM203L]KAF6642343.1 DUF1642 domain-containing protein [Lactococcus sp. EKM501L]KAF6646129.1 DUF1642 domain-containing protein [Lactococcus sp. EKM502L]KAF6654442.1 DUF1642 domain-containing protein [Lactococcus sp. EKM101L]KAF6674020.1 DUF1642 domain-containing protein [Lactococcus sp. EKM102L]